jgi:hypothetical protein
VSKLQSDQTSTQKAIADDKAAIAALLQSTPAYTAAVARQEADGEIVPVDQAIAAAAGYRLQQDTNNYGLGAGSTETYTIAFVQITSADTIADQAEINSVQFLLSAAQNRQTADQSTDDAAVVTARGAALAGSSARAALRSNQGKAPRVHAQDVSAVATTADGYLDPVIADYIQHDTQQLAKDQAALHAVVAVAQHKISLDDTAFDKATTADKAVIATALQASPAYTSALAKQQSDATTDANNVKTYQAILSAAEAKLSVDPANAPAEAISVYHSTPTNNLALKSSEFLFPVLTSLKNFTGANTTLPQIGSGFLTLSGASA